MSSSVTIRISRNKNVARDRSIAILKLNKLTHYEGQPVMVKYYSKSGKIDTLLALGIKDGIGEDCYKIVSISGLDLVRDVVSALPDISLLVHGELFLYINPEGVWNYVYELDNHRVVEPIENLEPTTFVCIKDKFRWFWDGNGTLKREDDFKTSSEINSIINDLFLIVGSPKLSVHVKGWFNKSTGLYEKPPYLSNKILDKVIIIVNIKTDNEKGITDKFNFYINGEKTELKYDNLNEDYYIEVTDIKETRIIQVEARVTVFKDTTYYYYSNVRLIFGNNCYYGYSIGNELDNTSWIDNEGFLFFENKTSYFKKLIGNNSSVTLENINLEKLGKIFIAYPINRLVQIKDEHGLDYLDEYKVTEFFYDYETDTTSTLHPTNSTDSNIIKYFLYVLKTPIEIKDFKQIFKSADNLDIEELDDIYVSQVKYDEIVYAWENKNDPGGIVQLDKFGKLEEDMLPDELSGGNLIQSEKIDNIINILL